tara:strand:- start:322 stop:429 length:108 start_codon:yes stop_codon:yes gene_type:complete
MELGVPDFRPDEPKYSIFNGLLMPKEQTGINIAHR